MEIKCDVLDAQAPGQVKLETLGNGKFTATEQSEVYHSKGSPHERVKVREMAV